MTGGRWRLPAAFCLIALLPGCQAISKSLSITKTDNPVLQPPPRRTSLDDSAAEQQLASADGEQPTIKPVSGTTASTADDTEVFNAKVIARVNGAPIFAGEVLERYGEYLVKARDKLPPEDYAELRNVIITRDLRSHIERRLLVERMRSKLKPDQIKLLQQHLDKMFEEQMVTKLKNDLKVTTRTELELALNERNTSMQALRDTFGNERMAMEFLYSSIERPPAPTRPEIVAYYQEHLDDFAIPARVKWQQIQISIDRRVSKSDAQAKLTEARRELEQGVSFDKVARKYSDGPTASEGGEWDWIQTGSLADTELEAKLFQMPVGQLSDVYATRDAFQIVRVTDRETESRTPLADVQDDISERIRKECEKDLPKKFVENLFEQAIIETDYEYQQPAA
ncbi:MAG: peptidylprolyl isomerase [Planctomycetaceae bacterium]|nr:peptidylprolyl isomerase [Planctomycetaceae bacterium]